MAESTTTPELLPVQEAAALVSVSTRTLQRLASDGRAPRPVRLGASVRWRRADIVAWIARGCPEVERRMRHRPMAAQSTEEVACEH